MALRTVGIKAPGGSRGTPVCGGSGRPCPCVMVQVGTVDLLQCLKCGGDAPKFRGHGFGIVVMRAVEPSLAAGGIAREFQQPAERIQPGHGGRERFRRHAVSSSTGDHRLERCMGCGRLVPIGRVDLPDHAFGNGAGRHAGERRLHVGPRGVDRIETGRYRHGVGPFPPAVLDVTAKRRQSRRGIALHHKIKQRPVQRLQFRRAQWRRPVRTAHRLAAIDRGDRRPMAAVAVEGRELGPGVGCRAGPWSRGRAGLPRDLVKKCMNRAQPAECPFVERIQL